MILVLRGNRNYDILPHEGAKIDLLIYGPEI